MAEDDLRKAQELERAILGAFNAAGIRHQFAFLLGRKIKVPEDIATLEAGSVVTVCKLNDDRKTVIVEVEQTGRIAEVPASEIANVPHLCTYPGCHKRAVEIVQERFSQPNAVESVTSPIECCDEHIGAVRDMVKRRVRESY